MPALAFVLNKHNLNSVAALTGALEVDPRTSGLALHFMWQDEDLHQQIDHLAAGTDLLIVALSFATADLAEAATLLADLRSLQTVRFLIAGGPHPSARPAAVLALGADAVVIGEGE